MEFSERKLISEYDGLELSVKYVIPEGKVKGIVQISHGMTEHKERYEDFMSFLASNGYAAVIHDHRGHGASVNDGSDLGYFYTDDISVAEESYGQGGAFLYPFVRVIDLYALYQSLAGRGLGAMFLERISLALVFLRLFGISGDGALYPCPPRLEPEEAFGGRRGALDYRSRVDYLFFLCPGCAGYRPFYASAGDRLGDVYHQLRDYYGRCVSCVLVH